MSAHPLYLEVYNSNMKLSDVKVVVAQVRANPIMQEWEFRSVCRSGNLKPEQITVINGLEKTISLDDLEDHHMLFIGGTGDYSIFDTLPITESLEHTLAYAKETNFPVLGSCWGGQLMARTFGGRVETDTERGEVGSYIAYSTDAAQIDPLFADAPKKFWIQVIHHESITRLPQGAVNLARSDRCEIQAFTWPESNLYGLQLHADMTKNELIERLTLHREVYAADPAAFNEIIDNAKETPHTDNLIAKFIQRIVIPANQK